MDLNITSLQGLGDNIFQRPYVRAAAKHNRIWIDSAFPEIYADISGLNFIRSNTNLRTQAKNVARQARRWSAPPRTARNVRFSYGAMLNTVPIMTTLESQLPLNGEPFVFDLPPAVVPSPVEGPYVIVRPTTLRTEWASNSRGPLPEYLQRAIDCCKARGLYVVTVADVDGRNEVFDGPDPVGMDVAFHRGELDTNQLLALYQGASAVVAGVGFSVPMAIAAGVPLYIVFGGRGLHNSFDKITDPRMDLSKVDAACPENYCMCSDARHNCNKQIVDFNGKFNGWLDKLCSTSLQSRSNWNGTMQMDSAIIPSI
jgi:hypothetical protein